MRTHSEITPAKTYISLNKPADGHGTLICTSEGFSEAGDYPFVQPRAVSGLIDMQRTVPREI